MSLFYTSSRFLLFTFILSVFLLIGYLLGAIFDLEYQYFYIIPIVLTIGIQLFCYFLMNRIGIGISEPIFILGAFLCFYTFFPAIQFFLGIDYIFINSPYIFSNLEITIHLFRLIFFQFVVVLFYFILFDLHDTNLKRDPFNHELLFFEASRIPSLFLPVSIVFICTFVLMSLSAPVETYYDNYTRYDHLPTLLRKVVSLLKRVYWGIIPIILVLIITTYRNKVSVMVIFIAIICASDLIISKGSRINTFMIVIQTLVIYNCIVNKIQLKKVISLAFGFIVFMSFLELYRLAVDGPNLENLNLIPGEFNAIFYPSIELFKLRELEAFPNLDDLMVFKDLFFVIPFFNVAEADPMHWFWVNFHPQAPVAPYTMGPIADSAFYGGWLGIFMRGFLLSLNVTLVRLLLTRCNLNWIVLTVFSFQVSVSILVLKYSVFSFQEQLFKNLIPTLIVIIFFNKVRILKRNSLGR